MAEAELCKVDDANKALNSQNRIVRSDIILNPSRKETGLLPALSGLERMIRHESNRTSTPKNAEVLPSLDLSSIGSKHRFRRPTATLHGVVFDIFGGSRGDQA